MNAISHEGPNRCIAVAARAAATFHEVCITAPGPLIPEFRYERVAAGGGQ